MDLIKCIWRPAAGILAAVLAAVGAAGAAEPPAPTPRAEVERAIAAAETAHQIPSTPSSARRLKVLLLADRKDHGPGEHDYPRWQARWALLLGGKSASDEAAANLYGPDRPALEAALGADGVTIARGYHWPEPAQWETSDVVVAFCYLEWTPARTKPGPSADVARLVGVGGFQRWRHGPLRLEMAAADHPICCGLPATVAWVDEPYWPPTPAVDPARIGVLAASREEVEAGTAGTVFAPQFWTWEQGKGRVFGCVPGHYSWTFDDPWFRLLVLRGIAWAAGEDALRLDGLALRSARVAEE
ncbi:MAG: ThuA domain-containing protein [Thermoguttaceae bacterium]